MIFPLIRAKITAQCVNQMKKIIKLLKLTKIKKILKEIKVQFEISSYSTLNILCLQYLSLTKINRSLFIFMVDTRFLVCIHSLILLFCPQVFFGVQLTLALVNLNFDTYHKVKYKETTQFSFFLKEKVYFLLDKFRE